uniref:Uncharacterized protein n=1 Tax=Glossina brevipalpis TaxID=37001 RepID=A0A1A9WYW3_9MUSC
MIVCSDLLRLIYLVYLSTLGKFKTIKYTICDDDYKRLFVEYNGIINRFALPKKLLLSDRLKNRKRLNRIIKRMEADSITLERCIEQFNRKYESFEKGKEILKLCRTELFTELVVPCNPSASSLTDLNNLVPMQNSCRTYSPQ